MTTLEATLAQVRAKRREVDWVKVGLACAFVLPWALGWAIRKTVLVLGVVVSFLWAAAVVGWSAATPPSADDGG